MIAAFVHAVLTAALLALGAAAVTPVLRSRGRPTRHLWLGTLLLAASWPLLQRAAIALLPRAAESEPSIGAALLAPVVVGASAASARWSADDVVAVAWLVLSSLLLLRVGIAIVRLARERATWRAERIDGVPVRVAPDAGPAVVGFARMEIVVPQWIVGLDPALRLLALRHEEEHRAARDPLLLLVAAVAVTLLPWNLPLWWIARRLRLAIELDCDARVLRHHPDATRYGRLLLLVAQRTGARALAPALSEGATNLQRRIDAMHGTFRLSMRQGALLGVATSILVGAACSLRAPTNATSNPAPETTEPARTAATPAVVDAAQTYFEFQVDTPAAIRKAVPPRYPDALRASGVEGEVVAQFVVDTAGVAQVSSLKVLRSNHEDFSAAVRAALPGFEFHPARMRGRTVRQLVQMPFQFGLSKKGAPTSARTAPTASAPPTAAVGPDSGARTTARQGSFEFTVDKPAAVRTAVPPRYPDHLRAANVEGEVVASFVIDTSGLAELSSFRVKRATDPAFVEAVKTALTSMTFHPAEVKGRKVRQLLEMPFQFSLSK